MRFARALVVLPTTGSVPEIVTYVRALLAPGARVVLRGASGDDVPPDPALLAGLGAAGVVVENALPDDAPPEVAIVPVSAGPDAVVELLAGKLPVACLVCPMPAVRSLAIVSWGDPRRVRPIAALLVRHPTEADVHLVSARGPAAPEGLGEVLGLRGTTAAHALGAGLLDGVARVEGFLRHTPVDLVATLAPPLGLAAFLERARELAPGVLLVPDDGPWLDLGESFDAFDVVAAGESTVLAVVAVDAAGRAGLPEERDLAVVVGGEVVGLATLRAGQAPVSCPEGDALGLAGDRSRPVDTLVATVPVLRSAGPPIVLVPVDVARWEVEAVRGDGRRVWGVATEVVRPSVIRAASGVDAVVQAGAVLDDGGAQDVPSVAGPIQLGRVARRLRSLGFPVVACVDADGGAGVRRLHRSELPPAPETDLALDTAPAVAAVEGLVAALRVRADAAGTEVGRLAWHTDNRAARERLMQLVGSARRRVLLQSYIFDDDAVGRAVAAALREAAGRGVEVRVLVDSLWARHGSLGLRNELLATLDPAPGVDVRVLRPVVAVRDLKQREHVKLLVVDGEIAVLPGRNVAGAYYTGFDEVVLTPHTPQHLVPWVDLSTELTGPVVGALEARFAAAWVEAGGTPLDPSPQPSGEGGTAAWLVTHRGLADATTLDAFRVLFESARREIVVLNTFPLQHELLHALLARLRAGVAVRFLTGHVRPRHQGGRTPFPGSAERDLMTDLVHGRLDALAEAGAEVTAVAAPSSASWDPALGTVLPHLHAKLAIADREVAAVGSANVDVASSFWESELLLVVRDATRVGALADWADGLAVAGLRFDPGDPAWRERAARRAWLSQSWPSLVA